MIVVQRNPQALTLLYEYGYTIHDTDRGRPKFSSVVFMCYEDIYVHEVGVCILFWYDDHLHYGFSSLCSVVNSQNYGTKEG